MRVKTSEVMEVHIRRGIKASEQFRGQRAFFVHLRPLDSSLF